MPRFETRVGEPFIDTNEVARKKDLQTQITHLETRLSHGTIVKNILGVNTSIPLTDRQRERREWQLEVLIFRLDHPTNYLPDRLASTNPNHDRSSPFINRPRVTIYYN